MPPLLAAVLAVPVLAGCGDDEPTSPAASASAGTSDPSDPASSSSASSSAGPLAEAATGPEVSTDHVTLNLPDGWRREKLSAGSTSASATPKDAGDISSIRVTDLEVPGDARPLDRLARESIDALGSQLDLTVQRPTEVGGIETYHVTGSFGQSIVVDEYGPSVDGAVVSIRFELWTLDSEKKRQQVIDSVLASVEWTI